MSHKQCINSFGHIVHSIDTTSTRHSDPGRRSAANQVGHSDPGRGCDGSLVGEGNPGRGSGGSWTGRVKAVEADKGRLMG